MIKDFGLLKIIIDSNNKVIMAKSRKFSDVPKKNNLKGAILTNYGRKYVNIGDENEAIWKIIKP